MALRVWSRYIVAWRAICRPDHARGSYGRWRGKWIWSIDPRAWDLRFAPMDCIGDRNISFSLESSQKSQRLSLVSDCFCDFLVCVSACNSYKLLWIHML